MHGTNHITVLQWNDFLHLFGPSISSALRRLKKLRSKAWFKPFVSKSEATRLLELHPVGTFLVRMNSDLKSLRLSHTMASQNVNHVIIRRRDDMFVTRGESGKEESFKSVAKLIKAFPSLLIHVNHHHSTSFFV